MAFSGLIVLLITMIAARILNERGYRILTPDEKVRLMDGFSAQRAYALIPIVVLTGAFFLLQPRLDRTVLMTAFFGLLIFYIIVRAVANHLKMQQLGIPDTYRRYHMVSQTISMLGVAWFLFATLQGGAF